MRKLSTLSACAAVLSLASSASAQATPFADAIVQAPELGPPSRGSIAGQYASVSFGPGDVARGAFSLPLPIALPNERGELPVSFVPTYSPDAAMTEWGAGWATPNLTIYRTRVVGDIDYQTDDRMGPWGRMVKGTDGAWYVVGLRALVRVEESGDDLIAYLPDGSQQTFGGIARTLTSAGTYAWYLRQVRTITGRVATYTYDANASGRLYLNKVSYGGTNAASPQTQITFDYDTLALSLPDDRPGTPVLLDRRVKAVHALVANGGAFTERYRFDLTYTQDGGSATFYLATLQQTFAGGTKAPVVTYTYNLSRDYFGKAAAQRVPKLDAILKAYGGDVIQPNRSTALDIDLDGRPDLELPFDGRVLKQTDAGFEVVPLPPAAANASPLCRKPVSSANAPRALARMRASVDEQDVVVVAGSSAQTAMLVCDRAGSPISQLAFAGDWTLGPNTRLVDMNRDHAPDLVRMSSGVVDVLPNTSTATQITFGAPIRTGLTPSIHPDATWVHDVNGDGIADLVSRNGSTLVVWRGKGNSTFESAGKTMSILSTIGGTIPNIPSYQFVFFDANNDGITDLLLTNGTSMLLFANNGTWFGQVSVPVFGATPWSSVHPVVLDMAGNGNTEIAYVQSGAAFAVDMDAPGVGLLATADDGRGTTVSFDYQRAAPEVGVRYRNSLFAGATVKSVGYDDVSYRYSYGKPDLHSTGKFLLGYEAVTRTGALDSAAMTFANADATPGTLLTSIEQDTLTPSMEHVSLRTYDDAILQGVPWKRLKSVSSGYRSTDAAHTSSQLETTDTLAYDHDVCPVSLRTTRAAGVLTRDITLSSLPAFSHALSCLDGHVVLTGTHPDPALDFKHEANLDRNAIGQVHDLGVLGASGLVPLQHVDYNPADNLVAAITEAGKGTTTYTYAAGTPLPQLVTTPDGVTRTFTRNPLSDAVTAITTNRGALSYVDSFTYDGRERLAQQWNNLGAATAAKPNTKYIYRDGSSTLPALVETDTLVDPVAASYAQAAELFTGKGESMARTRRIPEGWAFDALVGRIASQRLSTTYSRATATTDIASLDLASLYSGADWVTTRTASLAGETLSSSQRFHTGVERDTTSTFAFGGGLTRTEVENGALTTAATRDEANLITRDRNQSGAITTYTYDALRRLRAVTLADGSVHRSNYDALGRPQTIARDGVGTWTYNYESSTGLLAEKTIASPAGAKQRSIEYSYDAIGRVIVETDTDAVSGATTSFHYFYDGATPANPSGTGSRGLLTGVLGSQMVKTIAYRADGKESHTNITIAGQRTVLTDTIYAESGAIAEHTVTVEDASGAVLSKSRETTKRDAYGRDAEIDLDGAPLASLTYDVNGLPLWATFAEPVGHGEVVTLAHDPLTRAHVGTNENAGTWSAAFSTRLGVRGLVDHDDVSIAGTARTRTYGYAPPGFVGQATDGDGTYTYGYDASGLPSSIVSNLGGAVDTRAFQRAGAVLSAGSHHERFDAVGRAVEMDDVRVAYGPNGQIDTAQKGASSWSYIYDGSGRRIAKVVAGAIGTIFLADGSVIDKTARTEPVRFANVLVGVLRHDLTGAGAKHFALAAIDGRGSALSDAEGAPRAASPFGDRTVHPDVAAAIDFAESGYDADLGLIRMGVRDYDAHLSRFTTPDPVYLETPSKCVGHATDCTLYAYARNNPLQLVDPLGMDPNPAESTSTGMAATIGFNASALIGVGVGGGVGGEAGFKLGGGGSSRYTTASYVSPDPKTQTMAIGGGAGWSINFTWFFKAADVLGSGRSIYAQAGFFGGGIVLDGAGKMAGLSFSVGPKAELVIAATKTQTETGWPSPIPQPRADESAPTPAAAPAVTPSAAQSQSPSPSEPVIVPYAPDVVSSQSAVSSTPVTASTPSAETNVCAAAP